MEDDVFLDYKKRRVDGFFVREIFFPILRDFFLGIYFQFFYLEEFFSFYHITYNYLFTVKKIN